MSAGGSDNAGYPWLSHLTSSGLLEQPLATRPEVQRTVAVNWIQQRREALDIIYRVVATGQCICWIRNTVDDALDTYQQLLHEESFQIRIFCSSTAVLLLPIVLLLKIKP